MKIHKNDVPVIMQVPGATARLLPDFGDAKGYGKISGEFFSLAAGTDIAPLLQGLKGDACHAPHWGYLAQGVVTVSYTDGTKESVDEGELFYWPPGHSVRVEKDAELIMFSPQHEHIHVIDHMKAKLAG